MTKDVIIIGGGHNGLVAAAYLAKAGRAVTVLERRELVGGCCVTEELWPGFKMSTASFVTSMFEPKIIRELELEKYGFQFLPRDPASFIPFADGRSLTLWADMAKTQAEIAKFSKKDAEAWPKYIGWLAERAALMEPLMFETPPNMPPRSLGDFWDVAMLSLRHRKAAPYMHDIFELQTGSASDIVERWFESPQLKGALAVEGLLGAFAGPRSACTAFLLLHVAMGQTGGARGVWAYAKGGMGGVSNAIAAAAQQAGAKIRTGAGVEKILVENGRVKGVCLVGGEELKADTVLSNADPYNTFVRMVGASHLPDEFNKRMGELDYSSACLKMNIALKGLPHFKVLSEGEDQLKLRGSIHVCGPIDDVERAFDESKYGRPSEHPTLHCAIPSLVDDTIAPKGMHTMSVFAQYAPYDLAEGLHWDQIKDDFAERCIDKLEAHAPNIRELILHRQVLSPLDMERVYGLYRGNIFHGSMAATQMFSFRPAAYYARYRTPVQNLYLCGAGAHPGGGVTGIPGHNAAKAVLADGA